MRLCMYSGKYSVQQIKKRIKAHNYYVDEMQLNKDRILSDDVEVTQEEDNDVSFGDTQIDLDNTRQTQLDPFEDAEKDDELFKNQQLRLITPYSSDEEGETDGISAYLEELNAQDDNTVTTPSKSANNDAAKPIRRRIKKHVTIQSDPPSDDEQIELEELFPAGGASPEKAVDSNVSNGQKVFKRSRLIDEDD